MRIPKRITEILKRKETFLDEMRAKLENTVLRLQTKLFEQIIEDIIPQLEVEKGILKDNAHNYRLISELEKLYETFNIKIAETILPQINKATEGIVNLTERYFTVILPELPGRFERIIESTKTLIDLKIGLRQEKMIRGGLIQEMLKIDAQELQHLLSKSITGQSGIKDFISVIKENVNGTDIKSGVLDRQLKRFAYDTYQHYDAAYNKKIAEEFELNYFIYEGGLIVDSRDFCAAHDNKVWSIEETKEWETWTPVKGDYPAGYEVKAKDIYSVPSYLGYPGYDPLVDRGGYNCRHIIGFIPDDLAFKLRPELGKE